MSVHGAEPQDIYVDAQGKLWRCIGTFSEPTVIFEEVEGRVPEPPSPLANMQSYPPMPTAPKLIKERLRGAVNGLMWNGFKRIYRRGET